MNTLQVDILDPKAAKFLKMLAEMNLISIRKDKSDEFLKIIHKIRSKAKNNPPSLEEITKEVELVRADRYARSKR